MNFCLLLNTKQDILKNVGNQTVYGLLLYMDIVFFPMEVNGVYLASREITGIKCHIL